MSETLTLIISKSILPGPSESLTSAFESQSTRPSSLKKLSTGVGTLSCYIYTIFVLLG